MTQPPKIELFSTPRGEHMMPGKNNPALGTITPARFLNGRSPRAGLSDPERRTALAFQTTPAEPPARKPAGSVARTSRATVLKAQEFLIRSGTLKSKPSGRLNPATRAAIKAYQGTSIGNGPALVIDGGVDPVHTFLATATGDPIGGATLNVFTFSNRSRLSKTVDV